MKYRNPEGGSAPRPPGFIALGQDVGGGRRSERPPIPAPDGARVASLRGSILRQLKLVYRAGLVGWSRAADQPRLTVNLSLIDLSQRWGALQTVPNAPALAT